MHYTLKEPTTDTFQQSGVSHGDGVKEEGINLEVRGLNAAKTKPRKQGLLLYIYTRDDEQQSARESISHEISLLGKTKAAKVSVFPWTNSPGICTGQLQRRKAAQAPAS